MFFVFLIVDKAQNLNFYVKKIIIIKLKNQYGEKFCKIYFAGAKDLTT